MSSNVVIRQTPPTLNTTANEYCLIHRTLDHIGLLKKKSGEFQIHVTDSISIFENDWRDLVPNNHSLAVHHCKVYEQSAPNNISYRYAVAYQKERPVMCAMFQLIRITPENLRQPNKKAFLHFATNLMLQIHEINILVCGNVFKDGMAGFYHHPQLFKSSEVESTLNQILDKLQKEESVAAVMLKDVPEEFKWAAEPKALKLEDDISMYLRIDPTWKTLDDYQAALSKKYVARAKKILGSAHEIAIKQLDEAALLSHQEQLYNLYKQVVNRQPFTFGALDKEYFLLTKQLLKEQFSVYGFFLGKELVAFCSTISSEDSLDVHYIGFDYSLNPLYNLYFNIHFLVLKEAILAQKRFLKMGRTTLEAKAILGCLPNYHTTYLSFKKPLAECAYSYFSKNLSESDSWKARNPFKNTYSTTSRELSHALSKIHHPRTALFP